MVLFPIIGIDRSCLFTYLTFLMNQLQKNSISKIGGKKKNKDKALEAVDSDFKLFVSYRYILKLHSIISPLVNMYVPQIQEK